MSSGSVSEDNRKPAKWMKDPEKAFGLGFSISTGGSIFDPKQTARLFWISPLVSIGFRKSKQTKAKEAKATGDPIVIVDMSEEANEKPIESEKKTVRYPAEQ
jgi:hypothetical protein